jgi:hypothetical protein
MEVLKRKILLENSIDRSPNSQTWGTLTAETFFINVFLTQTYDDMGIFTELDFISADTINPQTVDYTILNNKLLSSGLTFSYMTDPTVYFTGTTSDFENFTLRDPSKIVSDYYNYLYLSLTGSTDSKISELMSYNATQMYIPGFDIVQTNYQNYENISLSAVSRVTVLGEPNKYVFDTIVDTNIGTDNQIYGLYYQDYTGKTNTVNINGIPTTIPLTVFTFVGEGQNETNTSLSAITKEEYLFGIISKPEVKNDVFIDRGVTSVFEPHLRLSEIKTLGELTRYGNGFYKIVRQ